MYQRNAQEGEWTLLSKSLLTLNQTEFYSQSQINFTLGLLSNIGECFPFFY